jgi:hypothetical protein
LFSNNLALCWCFALKLSWSFLVFLMLWNFHGFWSSLWVGWNFELKFQGLWLASRCIEALRCSAPRFWFG